MLQIPVEIIDDVIQAIAIPPEATQAVCDGTNWTIYFPDDTQPLPPEPEPEPDWESFRRAIATLPAYRRIASTDLLTNQLLVTALWQGAFNDVPLLWNAIAAQAKPTTGEIEALNTLAESTAVPFRLNSLGLIGPEPEPEPEPT